MTTETVGLSLTPSQLERLNEKAASDGYVSRSEWVREKLGLGPFR
ncbi:ribbon-helix-helix domain-containing protein [Halosimplex pelagicum]